ncbi:MAG: arginase [Gemmatimonadetes bacterium]|nr:MAG: arginase [Gemmatimonadota bacterium]
MSAEERPGRVAVTSVSIDLGAGRRGVDMGPSAVRIAGLSAQVEGLGYELIETGTVHAQAPETTERGDARAKYLGEITDVARRTRALVRRGLEDGCFPLVLGGDHSLSIGSVAAMAEFYRERGESIGLLWVDAHADLNTPETTPSGNIHGMSLAVLLGMGPTELTSVGGVEPSVRSEHVCVLGARDLDPPEREVIRETGVRVFTMTEVDERGIAACMREAIERMTDGTAGFVVSYDLDGVDPMVAPGVGTPVPGGLTYREAHLILETAARTGHLLGLEVVEVNPVLDDGNRTAKVAVGLIGSGLGKTIL